MVIRIQNSSMGQPLKERGGISLRGYEMSRGFGKKRRRWFRHYLIISILNTFPPQTLGSESGFGGYSGSGKHLDEG